MPKTADTGAYKHPPLKQIDSQVRCSHGDIWEGSMGQAKDNCFYCEATTCTDNPNWVDWFGDDCDWYAVNDSPGCPIYGNDGKFWEGSMGVANDICCYCAANNTPVP